MCCGPEKLLGLGFEIGLEGSGLESGEVGFRVLELKKGGLGHSVVGFPFPSPCLTVVASLFLHFCFSPLLSSYSVVIVASPSPLLQPPISPDFRHDVG